MENFIVSARKYRPATFDTVVGQNSITSTLKNAIRNNHLAQAFLFTGPRGIGKTTCARILAKTINCENLSENIEACNKCESCTSFNNSASFNIHELDAASNNSVDDIRNLVDQVRIPPQVGRYKIYIIDEVHMLSASAFNAFLKTLEEPPAYAKFILATTEKHKIIPTILSRCQIYDFKRITLKDIVNHLKFIADSESVEAEPKALHIIAQKADGALRDALSVFDQLVSFSGKSITYQGVIENLNILDFEYYFKIVKAILNNDISTSLLILNDIIENGFDGQHFLIGLGEHLRNLLVCKDAGTVKLLEVGDELKTDYQIQSDNCSVEFIFKSLEINNNCDINYKNSNNKRLHLELAIMQMCSLVLSDGGKIEQKKRYFHPPKPKTIVEENLSKEINKEIPQVKSEPPKEEKKETEVYNEEIIPELQKPKIMPNMPGSISIKQSTEKNGKEQKEQEETTEDESKKLVDNFTQEELILFWKKYAESISEKEPSFSSAIAKYNPVLKDDFIIEFKVDNKLVVGNNINILNLQGYLKKELNNFKINLAPVLAQKEDNKAAYTDAEKFNKMAKKNPELKNLKDQLDLEIEF
ncbi:MAG: DNA polymerase III subunit gamma/tau [Bacteroidales bacterium]|nr:DNA polymerase III subunit gamma/tau [Bacteroidales bacterium]